MNENIYGYRMNFRKLQGTGGYMFMNTSVYVKTVATKS